LAAITNGNVNCEAIGIDKYFTHTIQANPEYPMKPSPAMFDLISTKLGIAPQNILHVGDDLEKDVEGAIKAGYQSAWLAVNRPMQLKNERFARLLPHVQLDSLKDLKRLVYRVPQYKHAGLKENV
jgi:FMN phosphatase YigB (HAD superfamily)